MNVKTATRREWLNQRMALLEREKEFTKARDALSRARRELPMVRLDKDYQFDSTEGPQNLQDLFAGKSQLIVYHFMFGPDWEAGCKSCSYWIDNFEGVAPHLAARDTSLVLVSKAPLQKLTAFKARMGWTLPWVSAAACDFNEDYGVTFPENGGSEGVTYNFRKAKMNPGEMPGASVFVKDTEAAIYHTYSTYSRGLDILNSAYHLLDLTPKGRDEGDLSYGMEWLKLRDAY